MSFKQKMMHSEERAESNIILALDFPYNEKPKQLLSNCLKILESVAPFLCAVKINRQLILPLGLFGKVQTILTKAHDLELPTIMDAKINDIGNTNRAIAEYYYKGGFDAVIANPFVGWKEGLQPVFDVAQKMHHGVIVLIYMSHEGAVEGYGQIVQDPKTKQHVPQYKLFAEKALKWKADGAVVGATYPDKIREVHSVLREEVPIYSPGIGAQGGDIEAAVNAGAYYLIVGRRIIEAKNPAKMANRIRNVAWQCRKRKSAKSG